MTKNSIVVELPQIDSTTNKRKKVIHDFLIIKNNLEMRHGIILEFTEGDGSAIIPTNELQRQLFLPKQITKETDGKSTNLLTGIEALPDSPNAVSELEYWQNIDLTAYPGLASLPAEIKETLKSVKISDLVYWLIEQSILKGHAEGKY
ncbi:MAG TPA: hypothetical protein PKL56_15995 [Cyclobacteriaceae bacterium]|nr:hypothetical protein [Cyclobacteriaceae bacterium]HMX88039.1 hypothetical protein [Saprospiraceae bacterium]HMX00871.1 hypothetical protein [Cyclobacteriaceae bacterium]HMY93675.1 hypothetical protein [Cyclobacteriaceae bacterium]HNA12891.1 hypothetical protein [Cyclobacteriaceae bacterium]